MRKCTYRFLTFQHVKKVKNGSSWPQTNNDEKTTSREKCNVCRFLQKYRIGQNHPAGFYASKLIAEFLVQIYMKMMEHPFYSPDVMCDFWLSSNRKKTARGQRFDSEDWWGYKIYFTSIPINGCLEAFNFWNILLQNCIDVGGEYFKHYYKIFVSLTSTNCWFL